MLNQILQLGKFIGNTPYKKLTTDLKSNLFAQLEYYNLTGSIKDRPAYHILLNAIKKGKVDQRTTIIESSSGNFGIALATICKQLGLKFIPVIDANTSQEKENILKLLSHSVVKVNERDETGGYLLNRLRFIEGYLKNNENCYNPNQYENKDNYMSYYYTLGEEIEKNFENLDAVFISVSSGGTITGLSLKLKEVFKDVKIVAVDVKGSLVFRKESAVRNVSGIGSSKRAPIIEMAQIDDVVILDENEIIEGCKDLLNEQTIFGGSSSGAAYIAAKRYLRNRKGPGGNALIICPDKGNDYINTIYNEAWRNEITKSNKAILEPLCII